jgi:hypothetical protein
MLDDYKARLFPGEKRPVRKPKVLPGTWTKKEKRRLDKIVSEMVNNRSRPPTAAQIKAQGKRLDREVDELAADIAKLKAKSANS